MRKDISSGHLVQMSLEALLRKLENFKKLENFQGNQGSSNSNWVDWFGVRPHQLVFSSTVLGYIIFLLPCAKLLLSSADVLRGTT